MTVSTVQKNIVIIILSYCVSYITDVTIGFDPDTYAFNETAGRVSLTVRVLAGELARSVEVDFNTRDDTATSSAPEDYRGLATVLQFSSSDLVQQVFIDIIDDDITENSEFFDGLLSSLDAAVILAPDTARVEIVDNDRTLHINHPRMH